jgi:GNAT superfamily N-acetyltransferase
VLDDPAAVAGGGRTLVAADSAGFEQGEAGPPGHGHTVTLDAGAGLTLVARRGWAPFTDVEVARVAAFQEVLAAIDRHASAPAAFLAAGGAAVVLRIGTPDDAEAVSRLHARCSAHTLFARYHAGVRTLPSRLLLRLLSPPRGTTMLAQTGTEVVGLAQLIRTSRPDEAEVSVLVEDDWQGKGIGTAMIRRLAVLARAAGHRELIAWCLPNEPAFARTAASSGLPLSIRREEDMTRVALRVVDP